MAVKLDEEPVGAAPHRYPCLAPQLEPSHRRWMRDADLRVVDAGHRPATDPPREIEHQGSLQDQWERRRRVAAAQVPPPAVWGLLIERQGALVNSIDFADLSRGRCRRQGQVRIASGLGKYLHLVIHATVTTLI